MSKTINLYESIKRMDIETDCVYRLTELYEGCNLDEKKKEELVQYMNNYDVEATNRLLNTAFGEGVALCEDDISDDEARAICGDDYCSDEDNLSFADIDDEPGFVDTRKQSIISGDPSFDVGMDLYESTDTLKVGDKVIVKETNKPGVVTKLVDKDVVEVELDDGVDPIRLDRFYSNELVLDEGVAAVVGDAIGKGVKDVWQGAKNLGKGLADTGKDMVKTAKDVAAKASDNIKHSKIVGKATDAAKAFKGAENTDEYKANYKRLQKNRKARDKRWADKKAAAEKAADKGSTGKKTGTKPADKKSGTPTNAGKKGATPTDKGKKAGTTNNNQKGANDIKPEDLIYVVNGIRYSFDKFKALPPEKRKGARQYTSTGKRIPNAQVAQFLNDSLDRSAQLNEGPGAGYTINSDGYNVKGSVKTMNITDENGEFRVSGSCNLKGTASHVSAQSYYYGTALEDCDIAISRYTIYMHEVDGLTKEEVCDILVEQLARASYSFVYGGGWSHSEFDGSLTDGDYLSDTEYDIAANIMLTNYLEIGYIDAAVQGSNDEDDMTEFTEVDSKSVMDSDGFYTDYTWYKTSDDNNVFVFGDKDIYGPDNTDWDWETYDHSEAQDWFDSYNGFDDDDEDLTEASAVVNKSSRVDNVQTHKGSFSGVIAKHWDELTDLFNNMASAREIVDALEGWVEIEGLTGKNASYADSTLRKMRAERNVSKLASHIYNIYLKAESEDNASIDAKMNKRRYGESLSEDFTEDEIENMKDEILRAYESNRDMEKLIDKMIFQEYDTGDYDDPLSEVPVEVIKDTYDAVIVKNKQLSEDFRKDIDLDRLASDVAILLDTDVLGDNWIEVFPVGGDGMRFLKLEITGAGDETKRAIFLNRGDAVEVQFRNGSEAKFYSAEEIARFIAGEFGITLQESLDDETSKEWEHKDKEGRFGRIRQVDSNFHRKPLTRAQAKEIAIFRGHEDDELYPINEDTDVELAHNALSDNIEFLSEEELTSFCKYLVQGAHSADLDEVMHEIRTEYNWADLDDEEREQGGWRAWLLKALDEGLANSKFGRKEEVCQIILRLLYFLNEEEQSALFRKFGLMEAVEAPVDESFEDMLKDPEVQRRNAEYQNRMKAKYDKEMELAKEAKNWPDDKVLTYEEAVALARAYYNQGGDSFYETTDKDGFDYEVKEFGPRTVGSMKNSFGVFDAVRKDIMSEGVKYPNGQPVTDIDLDKALDHQFGTDRDKDNSIYTDDEKQRAINAWMDKIDPRPDGKSYNRLEGEVVEGFGDDHPYSYNEVYSELKDETDNFTIEGDTFKYWYKSEAEAAVKVLEQHYALVELDKWGSWFAVEFKDKLSDNP